MLRARKPLPPLIVLALGVVTAAVQGQFSSVDHARSASGVIAQHFDPEVRPQDDLFSHVNGTWLKTGEIPPEQVSQRALIELTESVDHAIRALIEDGSIDSDRDDRAARQVRDLYHSLLDEARLAALGFGPIEAQLKRID